MFSKREVQDIYSCISDNKDARIYLGCDSQRLKKKRVKFATVIIIHFHGNNGAKVFKDVVYEKVQDAKLSRPFNRMMKEVQLVTELYTSFEDILIERDFEIHIDVNPTPGTGSHVAYGAARGMIRGMIGVDPICKPDSWAASTVADRYSK